MRSSAMGARTGGGARRWGLERWQDLAAAGWDHGGPDPDPWRALAADAFSFRAALPSDGGALFRAAEALESVVNLRLALEQDPTFKRGRPC
ncbi:MAG: hypothetical protein ACRDG7_03170, partial [Candidatus Limnocylindria bacterium]